MCGIAGYLAPTPVGQERINATLETMRHRGPDDSGYFTDQLGDSFLGFLHTRLAIIDPDYRSAQPFHDDDLTLIFNGEIYNYLEIRKELEERGHTFKTTSDTEVIVKAWKQWEENCLDRFEGMWAFALFDQNEGHLYLCRDRFGEKPLLMMRRGKALYFASEATALATLNGHPLKANIRMLKRLMVNGFRSRFKRGGTFFEDVEELPPASLVKISPDGSVSTRRYWQLNYAPRPISEDDAVEGVRERLIDAVRIRLRSDVPLSFCLSGGIDSGILAGIAAKYFNLNINTFSIVDDDPRYDESEFIAATSEFSGTKSHLHRVIKENALDHLRKLVRHRGEPLMTITSYIHSFLSEAISENGFKVALSGSGADEVFTGYYDHYNFWLAEMKGRNDFPELLEQWQNSYGAFVQNPYLQDPLAFVEHPDRRDHIYMDSDHFDNYMTVPLGEPFEEENYTDNTLRNRMQNELLHEVQPVELREDDFNSMMVSVENRAPFLDRRLVEFMYTVPSEHLIRDGYSKWLLRAAGKDFLPDKVRLNKRKMGFTTSIDSLIDRSDPKTREHLLADSPIFEIVRHGAIVDLLNLDDIDNSRAKFLFSFISGKMFLESLGETETHVLL
jgi:asparagine synthase (glutamine-hydrolysing)